MLRLIGIALLGALIIAISGCAGVAAPSAQTPSTSPSPSPAPSPSPSPSGTPTIISVSPASVTAGHSDLTLTITGTNFVPLQNHRQTFAIWSVNGINTDLNTTFVSSTQLTAIVPAELLAASVVARILVVTDDLQSDAHHDGASSVAFTVNPPSTQPPPPVETGVNGNWIGRFIADMGPGHSVDGTISGPLVQTGTAIGSTGLKLESDRCFGAVFVRSGTVKGNVVKMEMIAADFAGVNFSGTLAGDQLSGTINVGSECGSGKGTLAITKIPAPTGNWTGTLHSDSTGLESQLTVSLIQTSSIVSKSTKTAPFSVSSLKVTGLIEHARTGCILQIATTTPGLLGAVEGLELNLESNGSPGIVLNGSLDSSATSLEGTYRLNGTSCDGETGTFALKRN